MLRMDYQKYSALTDEEMAERIRAIKNKLGTRLLFLAHNYQRRAIAELADFTGDSLELSRLAHQKKDAEFIVFAGVRFMAETARILAGSHQRVFLPNLLAGCPMADMAPVEKCEGAWEEIERILPGDVIPVTYVNSSAELKAFCGRKDGVCATSGNAREVFRWAYERRRVVLFFPDEYLGRNTANALGIPEAEQVLWDPDAKGGGAGLERLRKSRLILWRGYCHVHTDITVQDVERARREHPGAVILVHPECRCEVVEAADLAGSTKFMQDYVEQAPAGRKIILGTEVNHARNLSFRYPERTILPLTEEAVCPNMCKTSLAHLLFTLENLPGVNEIRVSASIQKEARQALERMLEAGPAKP